MLRFVLLALAAISTPAAAEMPVPSNAKPAPLALVKKIKGLIAQRMLDPSSVVIRAVHIIPAQIDGKSVQLVCGEYNAKNRFGGYAGFDGFVYEASDLKGVLTANFSTRRIAFFAEPGGVDFDGSPEGVRQAVRAGVSSSLLDWQINRYVNLAGVYFPICVGVKS